MGIFREFELQAIHLMAEGVLSSEQLAALHSVEAAARYDYTGSGYFLTVEHPLLPEAAQTLSDPPVVGNVDDVQCGFVVFLGQRELVLECHTWGAVDVPANMRDLPVNVSTPPANFVDLR